MICKYFLLFNRLPFHFNGFLSYAVFSLMLSHLLIFVFVVFDFLISVISIKDGNYTKISRKKQLSIMFVTFILRIISLCILILFEESPSISFLSLTSL